MPIYSNSYVDGFTYKGATFAQNVAMGLYPGFSLIKQFGENPTVTTAKSTIWDGGAGLYSYVDTPTTFYAASESADDTILGTGARTIKIDGLDANWEACECIVEMDGQNPSVLPTALIRIHGAEVLTAGNLESAADNIFIGTGTFVAGIPPNVYAKITYDFNKSMTAMYTVPVGHIAYIQEYFVMCGRGFEITVDSVIRPFGGVFKTSRRVGLYRNGFNFQNIIPFILPEKTDVEVRASVELGSVPVQAGFDIILRKL